MTTEIRTGRRPLAVLFSILGAAAVVALGLAILGRRSNPVYVVEVYHVVLALTGAIGALVGLAGLLVIRRYDLAALAGLATALLVSGWAALFSIGVLLILLAIIPVWLLVKRLAHGVDWPALLTGAGIGAGLLLLTWVAMLPPLVACGEDGATVSIDGRYGSASGGATSNDAGEVGWAEFNGHRLSYECQHGELVKFELNSTTD